MQPSLRQYADYFSICLLLGLCLPNEVIAWVDKHIEESDDPSDWMIELSASATKHPLDIIHLLDLVPGTKDLEVSLRLSIAKLGDVYPTLLPEHGQKAQPKHRQLFSNLYSLVLEHDELSNDIRGDIFQIYQYLDCVEQGYGNWSIIQLDYEELLAVGNSYKEWINF